MSMRRNHGLSARVFSALLAILLASFFFVRGEPAQNLRPAADFSGLDTFLELMALLEKDQEPTREQWDALFSTPGYAVLIQREFHQADYFAERFRLAFMPSRTDALKEQMKKDTGLRAKILPHYLRVKAMRGAIERWRGEQRPAELYAEAAKKAGNFLPEGAASGLPNVSFVIFAPDSRGYDPVVLDALYCMDQGTALANLVGHEFHHYYRNGLIELDQDQGTLWIINQIHAEGVADLIDKAGWIQKAETALTPEEKSYVKLFKETPAVLRTVDDLLSRMSGMKTGRGALGNDLRKAVPQSGHPTGLYMATLILEELGKEALVGVSVDPFAFFRLYQKAATKRSGETPCFSEKALAFLDRLALCR